MKYTLRKFTFEELAVHKFRYFKICQQWASFGADMFSRTVEWIELKMLFHNLLQTRNSKSAVAGEVTTLFKQRFHIGWKKERNSKATTTERIKTKKKVTSFRSKQMTENAICFGAPRRNKFNQINQLTKSKLSTSRKKRLI